MAILTSTEQDRPAILPDAAAQLLSLPMLGRALEALRGVTGAACRGLDLAILGVAFFAAILFNYGLPQQLSLLDLLGLQVSLSVLTVGAVFLVLWRGILNAVGLYNPLRIHTISAYVLRCIVGVGVCSLLMGLFVRFSMPTAGVFEVMSKYWGICLLLMLSARILLLCFDGSIRPHLRAKRNLLIVGTGMRAVDVYEEMKASPAVNYSLLGYVDSNPQTGHVSAEQVLGTIEQLEDILMHRVVDEVVIALPMKSQYETIGQIIATCERLGIQSQYFTNHFGTPVTKQRRATKNNQGRMVLDAVYNDDRLRLKRIFDVFGAIFGLIVFSPLLLATAIAIKLGSQGPILYRQPRYGLNKRIFPMLKFRSMVIDADAQQAKLEHLNETSGPAFKIANDPRVTPLGRFIRKMSIDELPQFVNVLLGDMSLVGPRPLPTRDVGRFSEAWLMRRFSVKPGLTCLWQIKGRSNTDFDRWIELDLEYIDRWSLALDFDILLHTIPAVLKGRGAS